MSVHSNGSIDASSLVGDAGSLNERKANRRTFFLRPLTARAASRAVSAGNKARDERRWGDAAAAYAKFLRLRPETAAVWAQLGHCLKESGNLTEAEAAYLKAMELDPENPDIILHVGRTRLALNDPASAAHYLERAASFASPGLDAAKELKALRARPADDALSAADKARDEKRWAEAIEAYQAFLRLRPDAANVWVQLGHCLKESGNADEAEKAYLKALELGPDNPDTLLHLGRVRQSMNDPATAARYFQRAAAVPSPASDAREELQALWSRLVASASAGDKAGEQNRWLDEIEAHAASLHGGKEAANFWAQLGCRLKEGGKHIEAEKAFLKALGLHPDDTDTLLQVGLIKLALDDPSSAALYLEKRWVHGHCLEGDEKPVEAEGACLSAPGPDETGVARVPAPRRLPCKLCGGLSRIVFGLPHNKKAGHPIPSEPDDCWYYQCDECNFLFTPALDSANHTEIYDDTYWKNQDPDWYGRVSQTFRRGLLRCPRFVLI